MDNGITMNIPGWGIVGFGGFGPSAPTHNDALPINSIAGGWGIVGFGGGYFGQGIIGPTVRPSLVTSGPIVDMEIEADTLALATNPDILYIRADVPILTL